MSNIIALFIAITLLCISVVPAYSGHDHHNHDKEKHVNKTVNIDNIEVKNGEAVIVVQGIVCSFCSQGVRRKLSKLPFIDHSRYSKGIKVEIENQKVTIAIKPGTEIDMDEVFRSIKSGGYEPVVALKNTNGETVVIYPED